jgi:hypothetical protein
MADAHPYENRALALCNTTDICVLEEHGKTVCSMHHAYVLEYTLIPIRLLTPIPRGATVSWVDIISSQQNVIRAATPSKAAYSLAMFFKTEAGIDAKSQIG